MIILDHTPQPFIAVMGEGGAVLGEIGAVIGAVKEEDQVRGGFSMRRFCRYLVSSRELNPSSRN